MSVCAFEDALQLKNVELAEQARIIINDVEFEPVLDPVFFETVPFSGGLKKTSFVPIFASIFLSNPVSVRRHAASRGTGRCVFLHSCAA